MLKNSTKIPQKSPENLGYLDDYHNTPPTILSTHTHSSKINNINKPLFKEYKISTKRIIGCKERKIERIKERKNGNQMFHVSSLSMNVIVCNISKALFLKRMSLTLAKCSLFSSSCVCVKMKMKAFCSRSQFFLSRSSHRLSLLQLDVEKGEKMKMKKNREKNSFLLFI